MTTFKVPQSPALTENNIDGFKVLEWKIKTDSSSIHHFFVKEHRCSGESNLHKPNGRTLLLMNLPPYIRKDSLHEMFNPFGRIQDIFIHQNPTMRLPEEEDPFFPTQNTIITGYGMAYIIFRLSTSLKDLLKLNSKEIPPFILTKTNTGLRKWIGDYNNRLIDVTVLEKNVKNFMTKFEKEELQKKEEAKANEGQADEEGWITVTRKGKRPGTPRTEKTEEILKAKKRRQEKQLMNFTPTQMKETRATQLLELKKKFDEDKQRVTLLRQQRKFKPF